MYCHAAIVDIEQNRLLKDQRSNMDVRLKSSEEDNERIRIERDGLRVRILELQTSLKEKEGEVRREKWKMGHQVLVIKIRMKNSIRNISKANYNIVFAMLTFEAGGTESRFAGFSEQCVIFKQYFFRYCVHYYHSPAK